ncbi:MAG: hydrogenase maturation protease [Anaerolineales bacterium]|jgi:hydrogenase maturation protease
MALTVVIGIGNPIRGDDALGWAVTEALQDVVSGEGIEFLCVQQLTMDLVELLGQACQAFFIDAKAGEAIGRLEITEIDANTSLDTPISHFFDPHTLLSVVQALYGTHPQARLYTVTSNSFEITEELTPQIRAVIPKLVSQIISDLIDTHPDLTIRLQTE